MYRLNGKVALITGASRGIGDALARAMVFILDGGQTAGITLFAWQTQEHAAA